MSRSSVYIKVFLKESELRHFYLVFWLGVVSVSVRPRPAGALVPGRVVPQYHRRRGSSRAAAAARLDTNMSTSDFYLRYYVGHKGKFGHEFLEFEFRPDGECVSKQRLL